MMSKIALVNLVLGMITALSILLIPLKITDESFATIQTNTNANSNQITNNTASSIFDTHQMVLGNNIKNLVILIPNEGHHGPQADEDRFLDQPFVPQNAIVNKGTNIV